MPLCLPREVALPYSGEKLSRVTPTSPNHVDCHSSLMAMKIAILGTRGIPARYGGFETFADELSRRLVNRGHQVSVYCRKPFTVPGDQYNGRIRRVILPTISHKYFDT